MTNRDREIIEFVKQCPCKSDTLCTMFFPGQRRANQRLRELTDKGYLKRYRETTWDKYFYYVGRRPKQMEHLDYIAKVYNWIKKQDCEIISFAVQEQMGKIIPDLIVNVKQRKEIKTLAVEVHLTCTNNLKSKIEAYEKLKIKSLIIASYNSEFKSSKLHIVNLKLKEL